MQDGYAAPSHDALRAHILTKFARFQLPDDFLVWPEIPMTSTGKDHPAPIRAFTRLATWTCYGERRGLVSGKMSKKDVRDKLAAQVRARLNP